MKPAATSPSPRLKPGSVVRCRTRRYLVEEVEPPMHRKVADGGDRVVTLACMEDDAIGQRLTVFLSSEIDFEVLGESSWEAVAQRGFDQPKQFASTPCAGTASPPPTPNCSRPPTGPVLM